MRARHKRRKVFQVHVTSDTRTRRRLTSKSLRNRPAAVSREPSGARRDIQSRRNLDNCAVPFDSRAFPGSLRPRRQPSNAARENGIIRDAELSVSLSIPFFGRPGIIEHSEGRV